MRPTSITTVIPGPDIQPEPACAAIGSAADFHGLRPRLFGIAYRMLGRVADAEDVVQDVWLRWQSADRSQVRDRVAFLVTITTRVSLNAAGSARARREIPVDHWLPGQAVTAEDPSLLSERSAELERAVVLLLQRLSPTERAVFVLREAFDYPFREIAERLGISEAGARQLARRARAHLEKPKQLPVQRVACDQLMKVFLSAARCGEVVPLERLLTEDAKSASIRERHTKVSHTETAVSTG
ncbi:sigma-70 family RNA polymerase sigma factor [Nocardia tengchongensis]|uniref:Sigma-70 family RNA polymerase sigma factor n=1 Tax=Nocardia tengchongensis TaxID=2055889 RepID=A0ABX8CX45_9NOCA|nr:sigma-70 family RNA polymerase sigma factor [Nocardia tengchongensis]QVI23768.1 sigma-70 family RNA polymerase sigma factor [Nocardia tengchongensis]